MDFLQIKNISIPEGSVKSLASGNVLLWRKYYYSVISGLAGLSLPRALQAPIRYLKQKGVCTQTTTPAPNAPVDIKCNNGVVKYGRYGKNWFGLNASPASTTYLDSTGGTGTSANWTLSDFIAVNPATQYTFNPNSTAGASAKIGYYTAEKTFISAIDSGPQTFTTPNNCFFMRFSYRNESSNIQLEVGSIATAYEPYHFGLHIEGNSEVLMVGGKNLNAGTIEHIGYTSTGGTSSSTTFAGTLHKIRTRQGEKFTVSCGNIPNGISGVFINTWLEDGSWNMRQAISATSGILTYTVGANIGWINFTLYKTGGVDLNENSWMQVEYGATATQYEPYVNPQIALVQNLFGVGNYEDEQEIVGGVLTHKVGIKVFDGTENFFASSVGWAYGITDKKKSKIDVLCTHYPYSSASMANAPDKSILSFASQNIGIKDSSFTSASDVTTWLAAQYAAGTPVIVIYPLADETTEQMAGQALNTEEGTNTITVNAEVNNVPLEVEYLRR